MWFFSHLPFLEPPCLLEFLRLIRMRTSHIISDHHVFLFNHRPFELLMVVLIGGDGGGDGGRNYELCYHPGQLDQEKTAVTDVGSYHNLHWREAGLGCLLQGRSLFSAWETSCNHQTSWCKYYNHRFYHKNWVHKGCSCPLVRGLGKRSRMIFTHSPVLFRIPS